MTAAAPRVLFIGNSHIAALRLAHAAFPDRWPDWDIYFLGMLAGHLAEMELRGSVLIPTTPTATWQMNFYNHVKRLDVGQFDAFVIAGGVSWIRSAVICADHRSLDFPSVIAGDDRCQLVGTRFLRAALWRRLSGSAAGMLLSRVKALGKPVVMAPEPTLSADARHDHDRYGAYLDLVARGDLDHWRGLYDAAVARTFGPDARIVGWPPDTLTPDRAFTRAELMRGSQRLAAGDGERHPDDDYEHANADYGALMTDAILDALRDSMGGHSALRGIGSVPRL